MIDQEIIEGLIARDNGATKEFFFRKCRPLFCSIIQKIFNYKVDYDEFISELYVYLMENDATYLLERLKEEFISVKNKLSSSEMEIFLNFQVGALLAHELCHHKMQMDSDYQIKKMDSIRKFISSLE